MNKLIVSLIIILLQILLLNTIYAQNAEISTDKDPGDYCFGDTVKYTNSSTGNYITTYWDFGDETDTWEKNPVHIYQSPGNYTVIMTIIFDGGTSESTSKDITINPSPVINLVYNEEEGYLNAGTGMENIEFQWYMGSIPVEVTDSIIYILESGYYSVSASNTLGCSDSASIYLNIGGENNQTDDSLSIIVANNILTPSVKDGANDVLFIKNLGEYLNPVVIYIYNKWGSLVYSNENYTNLGGFDGTDNNGNILDAGTYYYIVKSEGRKGGTGYIDIIR